MLISRNTLITEIPWNIVPPNLGWIVTLITLLGVAYKIGRWVQRVDDRFKKLEENPIIAASNKLLAKIISDLLYEVFEKRLKTNPLTPDEISLRRQLTEKLDARTITLMRQRFFMIPLGYRKLCFSVKNLLTL